ncbi:MAG: SDR family oxidoreductase [Pegethrix bostrychoides GSE-TBD4-15B]|jgi:NAD(P)-dependent dehydrogenase (short-subunit alcohol dehydrogenase family)|uniref:SDR family oxidoreductase n=1 Tax=Pegethrix bostrychoides GSE-TBD4-15B TaxID=2839662 RepID=A0A951U3B0_9CYAN|nr:SDR family oxidoreductase [Pegethrix bostrychoides GSE-TBD4-15B]
MNKTVIITGVLGGIGSATAQIFKNQGWTVIGIDFKEALEQLVGIDYFIQADVAESSAWELVDQKISDRVESVQALVNNAAIQICKPLIETTPEEWDRVMSVNLRSVYLGVRQMYPLLVVKGGAIVNVSSVHALATSTQIAAYAASKGGMLALTRAMALELAPSIRVNAILPGAVDTQMLRAGLDRGHVQGETREALVTTLGNKHVMGRVGKPKEIAEAISFLVDNSRSSFMTGQAIVIDGGATIRLSTE